MGRALRAQPSRAHVYTRGAAVAQAAGEPAGDSLRVIYIQDSRTRTGGGVWTDRKLSTWKKTRYLDQNHKNYFCLVVSLKISSSSVCYVLFDLFLQAALSWGWGGARCSCTRLAEKSCAPPGFTRCVPRAGRQCSRQCSRRPPSHLHSLRLGKGEESAASISHSLLRSTHHTGRGRRRLTGQWGAVDWRGRLLASARTRFSAIMKRFAM